MRNLIRWNPRNEMETTDPLRAIDEMFDDLWQKSRIVAMSFCEPRSCIGRLSS